MEDLVRLFKDNPRQAIERLFDLHYQQMVLASIRLVRDGNIAEDLAQEVFCELWKRRDNLEIKTSFGAYLHRAVVNKSLNYIKSRRLLTVEEDLLASEATPSQNPQDGLEEKELEKRIHEAIAQLPEKARIPFCLNRFEEMTYPEIADQLGVSVKTVEYQMSKALKLLHQTLEPYLKNLVSILAFQFLF